MYITKHAQKRLRERLGLNKKSMQRMVERAYDKGKDTEQFQGGMRQYLNNIEKSHKQLHGSKAFIKVYGDFIFLFVNENLITVFHEKHPTHKKRSRK